MHCSGPTLTKRIQLDIPPQRLNDEPCEGDYPSAKNEVPPPCQPCPQRCSTSRAATPCCSVLSLCLSLGGAPAKPQGGAVHDTVLGRDGLTGRERQPPTGRASAAVAALPLSRRTRRSSEGALDAIPRCRTRSRAGHQDLSAYGGGDGRLVRARVSCNGGRATRTPHAAVASPAHGCGEPPTEAGGTRLRHCAALCFSTLFARACTCAPVSCVSMRQRIRIATHTSALDAPAAVPGRHLQVSGRQRVVLSERIA